MAIVEKATIDPRMNKYGVVKRYDTVMFTRPIPENMGKLDALFFAAYIVAALDKNGEQFQQIIREVRRVD